MNNPLLISNANVTNSFDSDLKHVFTEKNVKKKEENVYNSYFLRGPGPLGGPGLVIMSFLAYMYTIKYYHINSIIVGVTTFKLNIYEKRGVCSF